MCESPGEFPRRGSGKSGECSDVEEMNSNGGGFVALKDSADLWESILGVGRGQGRGCSGGCNVSGVRWG